MTAAVVHLAVPGTKRTLCGLGDRKGPAVPYRSSVLPVPAFRPVCPDCRAELDRIDQEADG